MIRKHENYFFLSYTSLLIVLFSENVVICRRQLVEYYYSIQEIDSNVKFENLVTKIKNVLRVEDFLTEIPYSLKTYIFNVFEYKLIII